ncbi:MmcB family DNA repair protein [Acuticoccus mangrovi]|uniref:MmcB family DNA repair protein n=1 Tax=Acuticoccus mangrovi TaxID=2796142 RepID=A0A934IKB5_9HYPH|nr:MmcB family DNA repair protein [Acuticoccus mangrovi]MBJ3775367.1 MmcB family DNA repair protein [Acuticoccus mangrovi]
MPLLSAFDVEPMIDGRQSPAAMKVRRGVARLLRDLGAAVVPEVTLSSGRRADLVALNGRGEIWIVEIKSSLADFRADTKWPHYRTACDRLFFASLPEVGDIFPVEVGLIMTDGYAAEIVREAPLDRLATAARRALTLRIAQTAARRLHELEDPSPRLSVPL